MDWCLYGESVTWTTYKKEKKKKRGRGRSFLNGNAFLSFPIPGNFAQRTPLVGSMVGGSRSFYTLEFGLLRRFLVVNRPKFRMSVLPMGNMEGAVGYWVLTIHFRIASHALSRMGGQRLWCFFKMPFKTISCKSATCPSLFQLVIWKAAMILLSSLYGVIQKVPWSQPHFRIETERRWDFWKFPVKWALFGVMQHQHHFLDWHESIITWSTLICLYVDKKWRRCKKVWWRRQKVKVTGDS